MEENYKLSHLRELEAESIHIIREVAAEFENPVRLYSIGKVYSYKILINFQIFLNKNIVKINYINFHTSLII